MKRPGFGILLLASFLVTERLSLAQAPPPLIDRGLFFASADYGSGQLSPDGKYLAFVKLWKGVPNIWVKKAEEPLSAAHLVTVETRRPVSNYLWTRDSKFICYVADHQGDGSTNLYTVEPAIAAAKGADAPPSRAVTNHKGMSVQLLTTPANQPDLVYAAINARDKAWPDLYKVKLSTGDAVISRTNDQHISGWFFDLNGQLRLAQHIADNGEQQWLRVDPVNLVKTFACAATEICTPLRFHKDGKRVYMQSNQGAADDLAALVLMDPVTGKTERVESDPLKRADLGAAFFSEATGDLVYTSYTDDRTKRYFKDAAYEADFKLLESKIPGREVSVTSRSKDEQVWLVAAASDTEPGETFLYDRKSHALTSQYKLWEKLPRQSLSNMRSIRYRATDGLEIPAYLMVPKGSSGKGLPTVVLAHGGPWSRDVWGYNATAQFLANRGYAVLMPNFRGSTGYGKKFLAAGNGEWGRKMQDDLNAGVKYLIAQGTTDAKRVGIMGVSYGGYAALAGVTFFPDIYKAAVDVGGPSNLNTFLESFPSTWAAGRQMMYSRLADPGTPQGKVWLKERSPIEHAEQIKDPLLIVQALPARADTEVIVASLRDRGVPVEYLMSTDEEHNFSRPVNSAAMFLAVEKFLAANLEGRAQQEAPADVTKHLAELTIDPKTVKVVKKLDAGSLPVPRPTTELSPGTYKYRTKLAMNGKERVIETTTTIKMENGMWLATDTAKSASGSSSDTSALEKGSLIVRKRTIKEGPATIDIKFTDDKAFGTVTMNGQSRPYSASVPGPLFADAAGATQSIGCLPLASGYTLIYRNFDWRQQKARMMKLEVTGIETVTVPAGKFEAFKVELSSSEGGPDRATLWIAKNTRQPVKTMTLSTSMAGAVLTSELMP